MSDDGKTFIDDVREARAKLSAQYGHDIGRLCEAIRAIENEHPERLVRRPPRRHTPVPDLAYVRRLDRRRYHAYNRFVKRLSVYVETSIPSALYSVRESAFALAARELTLTWWNIRRQEFDLFTSEAAEEELLNGSFPKQTEMVACLDSIPRLALSSEVQGVAKRYADRLLMPSLDHLLDAVHLAVACVYECDVLLTWNIRHLANPNKLDHLAALNKELDLWTPKIMTPEHLMEPWP